MASASSNRRTLAALVAYTRAEGSPSRALVYARTLAAIDPTGSAVRQLVGSRAG
jgi:hypothetical protein